MAEAGFGFQMTGHQTRRIVALTCENHNQFNQFCVASLLVSRYEPAHSKQTHIG
jgi:hypothetical protein